MRTSRVHSADETGATTSPSSAKSTTSGTRRRKNSGRNSGRISQKQETTKRVLAKRAAAMNQAWKEAGTPGTKLVADDLAKIWLRDGGVCQYCGITVALRDASFDHEIPLSKGGPNSMGNLKLCCTTCQRSKYARSTEEYLTWRKLIVTCPIDGKKFKPRWADYKRGYGKYCSLSCAGKAGSQHV